MKSNNSIKPPILLKTILDILYILLIISIISSLILFILSLMFSEKIPFSVKINEYEIEEFSNAIILGISLEFIISGIFIYIIYILRKVVRSFFKRKLFTPLQISGLKLIGQLIIIGGLAEMVLAFVMKLIIENKATVGINIDSSFDSLWFQLALGLFFILLSKSFSFAGKLQDENDLTV
ncbi:MAG: DUF2975 domain-containing protein [Gillisia sp.]